MRFYSRNKFSPPSAPAAPLPAQIAAQVADLIIQIDQLLAGYLTLPPLLPVNSLFSTRPEWQVLRLLPHACQRV